MFSTLLVLALLGSFGVFGSVFTQDVMFSILGTIYDGVENSRQSGNNHYQLYIQWQEASSNAVECNYCHSSIQDKDVMWKYTSDDKKIDYTADAFTFPTSYNSNIPQFHINKERLLTKILKELVDMFSGIEIQLNGDSCCHMFTLVW